ncbi:MAG: hypothetical protein MJA82_12425 [Clostridia bacterium]|nr:hypothetical protein [Clostridia bacterium]
MEKPIRILHVLGRLGCGGAETMVMNTQKDQLQRIRRYILQKKLLIN